MKRVLFLLGHLDDLDIEWMTQNGYKLDLVTGDRLITKGNQVDHLFIVLSGKLAVCGGESEDQNIAMLGSGEVVGEMSFLESRPPSVSVIASEATSVFCVPRELINTRLSSNLEFRSNFYYALALYLSNRLRKTTDQLGYGAPEEEDLIDYKVLEGVSQGGARFSQILHKFAEV